MMLAETILRLALESPIADKDPERIAPIATAIADAAEERPLFAGEHGAERTALLLLTLAVHESALRQDVRTCKVRGDGGASLGSFQIGKWAHSGYTPQEVCSSDALQATLALRTLHRHREHGVRSLGGLLRAYASGSAATQSHQARELEATYRSVVLRAEQAP